MSSYFCNPIPALFNLSDTVFLWRTHSESWCCRKSPMSRVDGFTSFICLLVGLLMLFGVPCSYYLEDRTRGITPGAAIFFLALGFMLILQGICFRRAISRFCKKRMEEDKPDSMARCLLFPCYWCCCCDRGWSPPAFAAAGSPTARPVAIPAYLANDF